MKVTRIEHVAIAVDNLDETRSIFEDKLGLTLGYTEELEQGQTRIAMYPIGESQIELLQGMGPKALTSRWMADHGPGLFHICLQVDSVDAAVEECLSKGVRLLAGAPTAGHAGTRVAFIDPACTGNVLFELVEVRKRDRHSARS